MKNRKIYIKIWAISEMLLTINSIPSGVFGFIYKSNYQIHRPVIINDNKIYRMFHHHQPLCQCLLSLCGILRFPRKISLFKRKSYTHNLILPSLHSNQSFDRASYGDKTSAKSTQRQQNQKRKKNICTIYIKWKSQRITISISTLCKKIFCKFRTSRESALIILTPEKFHLKRLNALQSAWKLYSFTAMADVKDQHYSSAPENYFLLY